MNIVVLGLDGTEASRSAVRWCAENLEPGCNIVAVCGLRNFGELVMSIPPFDGAVIERKILDRLRRDWCQPLFEAGLHCRTRLVHRPQADAVVEVASSMHADAVVIGVELHHGIGAAFRRGELEKVIQRATCPVMLVPVNRSARTLEQPASHAVA